MKVRVKVKVVAPSVLFRLHCHLATHRHLGLSISEWQRPAVPQERQARQELQCVKRVPAGRRRSRVRADASPSLLRMAVVAGGIDACEMVMVIISMLTVKEAAEAEVEPETGRVTRKSGGGGGGAMADAAATATAVSDRKLQPKPAVSQGQTAAPVDRTKSTKPKEVMTGLRLAQMPRLPRPRLASTESRRMNIFQPRGMPDPDHPLREKM